jgi:Cu-processing system ATP-binding protein
MIKVRNLHKKFGRQTVLCNVNFEASQGQTIALIGPNGSGKTTLIKTLLGMNLPDAGDIFFFGNSIIRKHEYRNRVGYMPQAACFPENMTVAQVLHMMKDLRSSNQQPLDEELIAAFDIEEVMQKRIRTLSGGTRQKVSAVVSFLFNPDILILDEPTAGLDPLSNEKLKSKIRKEHKKGKLIIITSHVLSDLDDLVTEVMYLQDGQLKFHKPVLQLQQETGESKLNKVIASLMEEQQFV